MAKKITIDDIKKMLKSGNVIVGTQRTMKQLKTGKIEKVLMSSNVPEKVEKDIEHYAKLSGAESAKLDIPNDELGVVCRKPFSISVLAVVKGAGK